MEIVLASANPGKLREIEALLADLDVHIRTQTSLGVPAVAETGTTFVENAIIKARHAARHCALPALADDSGIMVDALDGAPGVHSARYAGAAARDADNLRKLLAATAQVAEPARGCRFVCVMVYLRHVEDPLPLIATGIWQGRLLSAPRGEHGFGYDPIFFDPQSGCAAAELDAGRKNRLSHRGQALAALRAQLAAERRP